MKKIEDYPKLYTSCVTDFYRVGTISWTPNFLSFTGFPGQNLIFFFYQWERLLGYKQKYTYLPY